MCHVYLYAHTTILLMDSQLLDDVCVCMCVCMYMYIYIYIYIYIYTSMCMYVSMYIFTYGMYVCMHTALHVHVHASYFSTHARRYSVQYKCVKLHFSHFSCTWRLLASNGVNYAELKKSLSIYGNFMHEKTNSLFNFSSHASWRNTCIMNMQLEP